MSQTGTVVLYCGSPIDLKVTSKGKKTNNPSGIFNKMEDYRYIYNSLHLKLSELLCDYGWIILWTAEHLELPSLPALLNASFI